MIREAEQTIDRTAKRTKTRKHILSNLDRYDLKSSCENPTPPGLRSLIPQHRPIPTFPHICMPWPDIKKQKYRLRRAL